MDNKGSKMFEQAARTIFIMIVIGLTLIGLAKFLQ